MQRQHLFLTYLVIAFLLSSCFAPLPISKLEPIEYSQSYWFHGTKMVVQSKDSVTVELGFIKRDGSLYIFDTIISNDGNQPILIDPASFFYTSFNERQDPIKKINAINPEFKILEQEKELSRLRAAGIRKATQGLIFGTVEIINELVPPKTDNEESSSSEYTALDHTIEELNEIDFKEQNSRSIQEYWENEPIRKTTLFPGYYIQGKIHVFWSKDAEEILMTIIIEDQEFNFLYKQYLIDVD